MNKKETDHPLDSLPGRWPDKIRGLRQENGRYRTERNQALVERDQARAELAALIKVLAASSQ